jgi:hypothetical protein
MTTFSVDYHGTLIEFSPLVDGGKIKGYLYQCPKGGHKAQNWIDTESGTRHVLTRAADGRVTIRASLLCAQGCGWHVFITDGVAVDA